MSCRSSHSGGPVRRSAILLLRFDAWRHRGNRKPLPVRSSLARLCAATTAVIPARLLTVISYPADPRQARESRSRRLALRRLDGARARPRGAKVGSRRRRSCSRGQWAGALPHLSRAKGCASAPSAAAARRGQSAPTPGSNWYDVWFPNLSPSPARAHAQAAARPRRDANGAALPQALPRRDEHDGQRAHALRARGAVARRRLRGRLLLRGRVALPPRQSLRGCSPSAARKIARNSGITSRCTLRSWIAIDSRQGSPAARYRRATVRNAFGGIRMAKLNINGKVRDVAVEPDTPLAVGDTRERRSHRHQVRLRRRAMRRVLGARQRQRRALVLHAGQRDQAHRPHRDHRGTFADELASGAAGMARARRPAMRLLPVGADHGRGGAAREDSRPERCGHRLGDDQHLPLRHLPAHSRGDPRRRRRPSQARQVRKPDGSDHDQDAPRQSVPPQFRRDVRRRGRRSRRRACTCRWRRRHRREGRGRRRSKSTPGSSSSRTTPASSASHVPRWARARSRGSPSS